MLFMYRNVFTFAALHLFFATVKGQLSPLVVQVGIQGSFYSPSTVAAAVNDTITFLFYGFSHTVTQSSSDNPCSPITGGFHSGYLGTGVNNSEPLQEWTLVISDVSNPIWFFCSVVNPSSHCAAGMVGVVNPPSQEAFSSFSSAAKMITTSASVGPSPTLSGVGAYATNTPVLAPVTTSPTPTPGSSLSTSSPTSTSTSSSSPTATTTPSNPNLGAIVGGAVGGALALVATILALWYFCIRNNQKSAAVAQNDDFFRYNPVTPRRPIDGFAETIGPTDSGRNLNHNHSMMSNTTSSVPTSRLAPLRRSPGPTGPVILEPPYLHRQMSQQSDLNSSSTNPTNTTGRNNSEQANNVDIRALAQEVAAVLYQNPAKDYSSQDPRQMTVQNNVEPEYSPSSQTSHQPPPNYRTAIGPSGPSSSVGAPTKARYP